jgi:uncharacterized protein YkwD
MKNVKRIITGTLVASILGLTVACGAVQEGSLPDSAAVRAEDADNSVIYIDDDGIALAKTLQTSEELVAAQNAVYTKVNERRAEGGAAGLKVSNGLADAAKVRAIEIVTKFSHERPNKSQWYTVNSKIMYGENLAKGFSSADGVMNGWMNSPGHKKNIMDPGFKTIGVSVHKDGGTWYWAQEFGY